MQASVFSEVVGAISACDAEGEEFIPHSDAGGSRRETDGSVGNNHNSFLLRNIIGLKTLLNLEPCTVCLIPKFDRRETCTTLMDRFAANRSRSECQLLPPVAEFIPA